MGRERREAKRVPCRVGIVLCDQPTDSKREVGDQVLTYALDLSSTGAFIASVRPLPPGTPVRLDFLVGRNGGVSVDGVVVRAGPSPNRMTLADRGIGIRFTRIDPSAVNYLSSVFRAR